MGNLLCLSPIKTCAALNNLYPLDLRNYPNTNFRTPLNLLSKLSFICITLLSIMESFSINLQQINLLLLLKI